LFSHWTLRWHPPLQHSPEIQHQAWLSSFDLHVPWKQKCYWKVSYKMFWQLTSKRQKIIKDSGHWTRQSSPLNQFLLPCMNPPIHTPNVARQSTIIQTKFVDGSPYQTLVNYVTEIWFKMTVLLKYSHLVWKSYLPSPPPFHYIIYEYSP
jgi:hypothetical protein